MAGRALTLRLKAKDGQHVINQLTLESTLEDLKSTISKVTNIPSSALRLLKGFPPTVITTSNGQEKLSGLELRTGDTLIVEEDTTVKATLEQQRTESLLRELEAQMGTQNGILVRKVVPANNSCLFTSVNFVVDNANLDLSVAPTMRQLIASVVSSDPHTYNEAILGKSNTDYCSWILNDESWGGAIEVSILTKYYGVEIDVVDTQSVRINRFGEDQSYARRVLLIYDGIHYDPLMMEPLDPSMPSRTIFSTDDDYVLTQALELAAEAKSSRQFTDTAKFTLRCLVCNKNLTGQAEAQTHASDTGHINFGEVWISEMLGYLKFLQLFGVGLKFQSEVLNLERFVFLCTWLDILGTFYVSLLHCIILRMQKYEYKEKLLRFCRGQDWKGSSRNDWKGKTDQNLYQTSKR